MSSAPTPPWNSDAEQAVIGAAMQSTEVLNAAMDRLQPDDFYSPRHRSIFEAVQELFGASLPVDALTVADKLGSSRLDEVGGKLFITELLDAWSTTQSALRAIEIVIEKATRRRLMRAGQRVIDVSVGDDEIAVALDEAEQQVYGVGRGKAVSVAVPVRDLLTDAFTSIEELQDGAEDGHIRTGLHDLDRLVRLTPGSLTVVAARPSHGKTALCSQITLAAAHEGHAALMVSAEMTGLELTVRFLSSEARVASDKLRHDTERLTEHEWSRMSAVLGRLAELPIYIDDQTTTMMQIRSVVRRLKQRVPLGLVVIDYLQLLAPMRQTDNRQQEVADLSRAMKLLARDAEVAVVCAAQLNRQVEMRSNKKPVLADIRESGAPEQDADVVMMLYRPEQYDKWDRPGEADIIVAKQRNGPTGSVTVTFLADYTKFHDLQKEGRR